MRALAISLSLGAAVGSSVVFAACTSSDGAAPTIDAGAVIDAGDAAALDAGPWAFPETPPATLSETPLFAAGAPIVNGRVVPTSGNEPYELSTALFSDYAVKQRTLWFPEGAQAAYDPQEVLQLPVGTVITKTFTMLADRRAPDGAARVIETRLLVRRASGWEAFPYVWNDAQTEATLAPGGRVIDISTIDATGAPQQFAYLVPSRNQCQECHHFLVGGTQQLTPIGPKARYLNFDVTRDGVAENQLVRLARLGKLAGLPALADRPKAVDAFAADPNAFTLDERARAYLDINCAHCHRPEATAGVTSQLFLNRGNTNAFNLGECKRPGSAGPGVGGDFDIVPGSHGTSILWFRMQTVESGKMMPAIGRATQHVEGAKLLADWIDAMPARDCTQ